MKNILFLTHLYPYPADDGGRIVTYNTLKNFVQYGHRVYLCVFSDQENSEIELEMPIDVEIIKVPISYRNTPKLLLKNIVSKMSYNMQKYINDDMKRAIEEILDAKQIDIVYMDHLHMAYYSENIRLRKNTTIVLRQHNVESQIMERVYKKEKNIIKKIFLLYQFIKLRNYERNITGRFDRVYMITKEDQALMHKLNPEANLALLPAGVDTEKYYPIPKSSTGNEPIITFLGSLSWYPNIDGLRWFVNNVFPRVIKEIPNVKLYIVGKDPSSELIKYKSLYPKNIMITGYVEDERPYIAQSDVFIVPLFIGGGMRIKILNALAMKMPVISTSIGAEGIEATGGAICIADTTDQFLEQTLKIMRNKEIAEEFASIGYKLILRNYDNKSILMNHASELNELMKD
ncbi:glycosyltransferase [Paenibacillus sp. PR3]|uniref:Glycosyltransferase n=1 Tax=Paenibacillus terricola TaxID=2763503 RepID=A0ABR8MXJ6_9BACL|nr:glycosyltransferase family 4 protein [Paenibacillus terricola]MBD3920693.1 glycosyltransferase [Paenibacillus terricola]